MSGTGHRDVIVIGASAGGLMALQALLPGLPADLPAAIFIATHMGTNSHLATILAAASSLPVVQAAQGQAIEHGRIHVAVPGLHFLLHEQHVQLSRGPHENMARPAIDPLFRSAACAFGPRVIGVVLSGMLDDGASGLRAIHRCGGRTVVQTPADAAFPEMPRNAMRRVPIDHVGPAAELGALLAELVREPAGEMPPIPPDIRLEAAIAALEPVGMADEDSLGEPSRFTCPECHGTLWEIVDGPLLRYRCHTGHAYTADAMAHAQTVRVEETLWILMRGHHERAALARRMAAQDEAAGRILLANQLRQRATRYDEDAETIRGLLRDCDLAASRQEGS